MAGPGLGEISYPKLIHLPHTPPLILSRNLSIYRIYQSREGRVLPPKSENRAPDPHQALFFQVIRNNRAKDYNEVKFETEDVVLPYNASNSFIKFGFQ